MRNQILDQRVFLVQKCLKVINAQLPDIMARKGCDASNIYDEEIPERDREYSDDEMEREAKKKRKKKRGAGQSSDSDADDEEGEIKGANGQSVKGILKNKQKHKGPNPKRFNQGTSIPKYSASIPINMQQPPTISQAILNNVMHGGQYYQGQYMYP